MWKDMQAIESRWYQDGAVNALYDSVLKSLHPVAALPTASGKSIILVKLCEKFLSENDKDILILSHTKEILKQDYAALKNYDFKDVGIYSAGLNRREFKNKIVVAGIQSIYRKPELFKNVGLVIIDECHLVSPENETMYRKLFLKLNAQFCGLTATPYRLGSGYIYTGKNALFNDLCYDLTTFENFNRLVDEGYLSKLVTKKVNENLDTGNLKLFGGDYKIKDMSEEFDSEEINEKIVKEIVEAGKKYKKWLVFAIDIQHAENLELLFKKHGILAKCVHSDMEDDREEILYAYKIGVIQCIINVNILTTGFDEPEIDLLAVVRPTESKSLHVQIIGRGMRIHPDKDHCLIMDFAGNTSRLGAINDIQIDDEETKDEEEKESPTRDCPECGNIQSRRYKECQHCGYEFPIMEREQSKKLTIEASNVDIFKTKKNTATPDTWRGVFGIDIRRKEGWGGSPDSMYVDYITTSGVVHEQICYDHDGYPKHRANLFVKSRLGYIKNLRMPKDLDELFKASKFFRKPKSIRADTNTKYHKILDVKW